MEKKVIHDLGLMYYNRDDLKQDCIKAVQWFKKCTASHTIGTDKGYYANKTDCKLTARYII